MTTTDTTAGDALRDPTIEAWLDENHVTWTFDPELDLNRIDGPASVSNQARLEPIDPEVVDRYAAAIAAGDQMPPLLIHERPRTRKPAQLVILGGNHRNAALAANKRTSHPAYLVRCEPEAATLLMYEDNRRHGLAPSDEERIAQAVHLMDQGYSMEAAAKAVGIGAGKVQRAKGAVTADRRAAAAGIDGFTHLPKTARWRLGSVRSDPAFVEAAKLAVASRMQVNDVYDLVTKVNETRSDKAALAIIGTELEVRRDQIQRTAGGKANGSRNARHKVLDACTAIAGTNPLEVVNACANDDQRELLAKRCLEVGKHLKAIHDIARGRL